MTHQHRDCLQLFRFFFPPPLFLFWFLFSFPQPPGHFKIGIHGRVRNQIPPVWCGIVVILGGSWNAWVPSSNLLGGKDSLPSVDLRGSHCFWTLGRLGRVGGTCQGGCHQRDIDVIRSLGWKENGCSGYRRMVPTRNQMAELSQICFGLMLVQTVKSRSPCGRRGLLWDITRFIRGHEGVAILMGREPQGEERERGLCPHHLWEPSASQEGALFRN